MQQPPSSILVEGKKKKKATKKKATKKKVKKEAPAVDFTEAELDSFLSVDAIDQELKKMGSKNILPSQVTADVIDAVRWQESKEDELQKMKTEDARDEKPWISDLTEDFVTFGISPASTEEEVTLILKNLDETLSGQEDAGFGPDARNYIVNLRRELEIILEKL
jgi:hypothetical protein